MIKERDVGGTHPFSATDATTSPSQSASRAQKNGNSNGRLDKRLIEQRIEEDRERHKRLRESIWAVPGEGDEEMERVWEEASDIAEDDYLGGEEEMEERKRVVGDRY